MILIYSKDIDDFVNKVIDYLEDDFIRIGNRDFVEVKQIMIGNDCGFKLSGNYFNLIDLNKIGTIWFNGGIVNNGSTFYEDMCSQTLIDSMLTHLIRYLN